MTPFRLYTVSVQVQRATHCTTGQRVALKQVYVKQPTRGPSALTDPEDAALREITALQTINHPHVVTLHDVFTKVRRTPCCIWATLSAHGIVKGSKGSGFTNVHLSLITTSVLALIRLESSAMKKHYDMAIEALHQCMQKLYYSPGFLSAG